MHSFSFCILSLISILSTAEINLQKDSPTFFIEKECITSIIAADDSLGKIRNHACENATLSMSIRNYVSGLKKLNFKNCPPGFEKAFDKHKKAWIAMLKITNKYPDMRGEMHELFDQLDKGNDAIEFKKYLKNIWDTWADIEKFIKSN